MKPDTAYSILREIGNEILSGYIYENIAEPIFDSHRITNPFPQDFKGHYERMLTAHSIEGSVEARNIVIANLIGIYLGRNKKALKIRKIGNNVSKNMNGKETQTSLWEKIL